MTKETQLMSTYRDWLPADAEDATLIGRVWDRSVEGPRVVLVERDAVSDLTDRWPTVRDLVEETPDSDEIRAARGERIDVPADAFLAPLDLQAVKAAGVTFAVSMLERVIEERAGGDPASADRIRETIGAVVADGIAGIRPGTAAAERVKAALIAEGIWSQYLEVGIGPDAEIFTKGQPMSAVGPGADVGVLADSRWNNPEPEVALAVSSRGAIVGAMLGNDVNLRDIEGRSALLLPRAKDNNASCALGPFLRWFDDGFGLDEVRAEVVSLAVRGEDGFSLDDASDMSLITRDPADLVAQLLGPHHQYPDGAVLLLGTMFAPLVDRDAPGQGFTHHVGDRVTVSSPRLGRLDNRVRHSEDCAPWTFGAADLMRNLARRGQLLMEGTDR